MKTLPPGLRAKHRRLLNFMLSPEFTKLSAASGGTVAAPPPKKKPGSASSTSKPRNHYGMWFIDTPEGVLLLDATFRNAPTAPCAIAATVHSSRPAFLVR